MSKDKKIFNLEERLIDFAVRIISIFLVRYSIFVFHDSTMIVY